MNRVPFARLLAAGLVAAALAGCATPPGTTPEAVALLARADAVLRLADPARTAMLSVNPPEVRVGQPVQLQLASTRAGFAYVFQLGTDGRTLTMVFPNAMDGANQVAVGAVLTLPRPGYTLTARGPAGQGYLLAVVTDKPQDLLALTRSVAEQRINLDGPYGAAMVPLRELAP